MILDSFYSFNRLFRETKFAPFWLLFLLLLTRLRDFEKNADQCHMWCDHFLSAINQFWWALFHYDFKSFIRFGTQKQFYVSFPLRTFSQDLENLPNDMIMTDYISCQKLDETSRRLKLPHSKVQDEVPSIHWNQWHPENSVRSLSWIIRHSLPTNKLFCCKLDCWTKLNISQAFFLRQMAAHDQMRAVIKDAAPIWVLCGTFGTDAQTGSVPCRKRDTIFCLK